MSKTQVIIPDSVLDNLRVGLRADNDDPEQNEALRAAVKDLLDLVPVDGAGEREYAFEASLHGVVRVRAASRGEAVRKLGLFEDVDCCVSYEEAVLTSVSVLPDPVVLIEIDGREIGT